MKEEEGEEKEEEEDQEVTLSGAILDPTSKLREENSRELDVEKEKSKIYKTQKPKTKRI